MSYRLVKALNLKSVFLIITYDTMVAFPCLAARASSCVILYFYDC